MDQLENWLVVVTKPRMESNAKDHLIRQGFEVYLPLWLELKRRRSVWEKIHSPMFPRYLFTRPSCLEKSIAPIRSTRGVSQLLRFGAKPAQVSESLIDNIRQFEASRSGLSLAPFKKGDQVQVVDGPFKDVSAEVLSCNQQRVILLLEILGKSQHLEFDVTACQQAVR